MEILIGFGLSCLPFGLTEDMVVQKLGIPDKIYETDGGCKRTQYNSLKLDLSFEPENENRLGWIEVHNRDAKFLDESIFNLNKKEILDLLSGHSKYTPETEDYGSFLSVFYGEHWLELQLKFDSLECVSFGVLYDGADEPLWPKSI